MPTSVTVDLTGVTPYNIYLCDFPSATTCFWLTGTSVSSYTFEIPPPMDTMFTNFVLKVENGNGCFLTQSFSI